VLGEPGRAIPMSGAVAPREVDPDLACPDPPLGEKGLAIGGCLPRAALERGLLLLFGRRGLARETVPGEALLDLLGASAEGGELTAIDVRELEEAFASVAQGVAGALQLRGELGAVDGAEVAGGLDDLVVAERPPLAVAALGEVQHEGVRVELWILLSARLVTELRHHEVLGVLHLALAVLFLPTICRASTSCPANASKRWRRSNAASIPPTGEASRRN
jgi:hypothetical protein